MAVGFGEMAQRLIAHMLSVPMSGDLQLPVTSASVIQRPLLDSLGTCSYTCTDPHKGT